VAKVEIMLGDSNPLVLSAMSEVFERDQRFSLVATTATAEGFLGMAMRVTINVGVIDWNIPALGAEKLTEVLRSQEKAPRIVIYGHDHDPSAPRRAMSIGAAAFVSRSAPTETLVQTCLEVADGKMVFPFLDVRDLRSDPISTLSRKERAILEALSEGLTNKQLSNRLGISTNTVKFHLSNIFDKLSVKNRAQAIAFFYANRANGEK
jgi:two-component system nitrate/nitrite response regulator NarP